MDLFSKPDNGKLKSLNNLYGKKKVIVYTGSLGLMDDGILMIEAMRFVSNPEIVLVILGDGAERLELEAKVRKEGINNVEFKGLVPKHEIVCWLNLAQGALVLFKNYSVLQGSSPNKLFDALAAGCPVIHNTTGWLLELTNETECGIAVIPDEPHILAQEIERLCNDDDLRGKMSEKARFVAGSMFNRDHHAEEYICKIKQLLN
jgi:glycosyltransferase involved in cell wall biosynthesis